MSIMDVAQVVNAQFAIPVGIVIICVVLVFALGFKSVAEPTQEQLAVITDDRKPGAKKKRKPDNKPVAKPQSNGHVVQAREVTKKEDTVVKVEPKTTPKAVKKEPVVAQEKTKGKSRKEDIPEDFYDGDWVQAVSKKERKQKRKDDDSTGLLLTAQGTGLSSSEESTPSKKRKRGKKKAAESGEKKEDSDKSPGTDSEKPVDVPVQKEAETKPEKKIAEKTSAPPPQEKTPPPQEKKTAEAEKTAKPARAEEKPKKSSEKKSKKITEEVKPEKEELPAEVTPKEGAPGTESKNATESQDESKSKKKKKKKAATSESSPPPVAKEPKVEEGRLKPQVEVAPKSETSSNPPPAEPATGTVAFDELGDTEKDTKPQKKKKKARRD